jgi:hypothetical protein
MLPNQNIALDQLPVESIASIKILIKTVKVSYFINGLHKSTFISTATTTRREFNQTSEMKEVLINVN